MNITNDWTLLTSTNDIAISKCIVGLENETNAFFLRAHPCINDYRSPDLPALLVCLMYLDQMDVSVIFVKNENKLVFQMYKTRILIVISGTLIITNSTF